MSKLLKRALKISLTPAILMIAGKFLGIVVPSIIYNLEFFVQNDVQGLVSIQILFTDSNVTLFVNSMSNLSMLLFLAIPTIYFITKTSIYQTTLQNPRTVVKITRLNILKWITKRDTSFLQIFIWTAFLTIASIIIIIHTLEGQTYEWIGISAGVLTLLCIWGTIKTFELETDKIYPKENNYY
jgi:hypothetical protein